MSQMSKSKPIAPLTREEAEKIRFILRTFYVVSFRNAYAHKSEEIPLKELKFATTPTIHFDTNTHEVRVDLLFQMFRREMKGENLLVEIETATAFSTTGVVVKDLGETSQLKLPAQMVVSMIAEAISSTRGSLSLLSQGQFVLPLIDASKFDLSKLQFVEPRPENWLKVSPKTL